MNKLGHQVQQWTPATKETIHKAPGHVLKLIGTSALDWSEIQWWREQRPHGILIYRPYWQYQNLNDPLEKAIEAVSQLGPRMRLFDYIEGLNETSQDTRGLPAYARWCLEYGRVLHGYGLKYLGGSFSRGQPKLELLPYFFPGLENMDALGLHEYGYPDRVGDLGRHLEVLQLLESRGYNIPIIISEMGSIDDDQVGGWRKYESPDAMSNTMKWYGSLVANNPKVLGVATFGTGLFPPFESFDLAGVSEFESTLNTEINAVPDNTAEEYAVGPGIKHAMNELGDTPASSEVWVGHLGSYATGVLNRYHYNKDHNQVYVSYPFQTGPA